MNDALVFDQRRKELLSSALYTFGKDNVLRSGDVVLGGGAVLACRWQHRISSDISLFTSESSYEHVKPAILERIRETGANFRFLENGLHCKLADGQEFSLTGSSNVSKQPSGPETETEYGLGTHSTTEILLRKIRARMLHQPDYLIRDVYDIVCCRIHAPSAWKALFGCLEPQELESLVWDRTQNEIVLNTEQTLVNPLHPLLAQGNVLRESLFDLFKEKLKASALAPLIGSGFQGPIKSLGRD